MKDVAGSRRTPGGPVGYNLVERHSRMFNVVLVLTLIALFAFAAFLMSDILSFKSNASYEEPFSVLSFLDSKERKMTMKDQQEDAIKLADKGGDREPVRVLENATADNSSSEGIGMSPSSLNSSLNNASTLTRQTAGTAVAIIKPSSRDSHKSDKKKKHSSSNSSSKNDIQVNRDGASPSTTAVENRSQLNQSQSRINQSSNVSLNPSALAPKINATEIPSYLSLPEDTGISSVSSGNSSANPDALSQLDMNSNVLFTPDELDNDLAPVANFSARLNVSELSLADNGTSNLDADATIGPEDDVPIEPLPELSQASGTARDGEGIGNYSLDDGILLPGDISSEPQYPEHSTTTDRNWPVDNPEEPAQFAIPQADGFENSELDFAEPTGEVISADKSSSRWQDAENNRINNRDKRDKPAKSPKRPTPPARPARTRPVRPARDNSR
jgi:hypothetical protein